LDEKRWRATAVQDAGAFKLTSEIREASWSAPALWRFGRRRVTANYAKYAKEIPILIFAWFAWFAVEMDGARVCDPQRLRQFGRVRMRREREDG
jgi:hypothetical protein